MMTCPACLSCPAGIPIDGKTVFTSDHALKLEWLPQWIAIIGSGYIGLEFSDVYTALGCEVTFIEVRLIAQPDHDTAALCCLQTPACAAACRALERSVAARDTLQERPHAGMLMDACRVLPLPLLLPPACLAGHGQAHARL